MRNIYFLSLVGTDAAKRGGEPIPGLALYFYDVVMKFILRHGIDRLSAQDLNDFHEEQQNTRSSENNKLDIYLRC